MSGCLWLKVPLYFCVIFILIYFLYSLLLCIIIFIIIIFIFIIYLPVSEKTEKMALSWYSWISLEHKCYNKLLSDLTYTLGVNLLISLVFHKMPFLSRHICGTSICRILLNLLEVSILCGLKLFSFWKRNTLEQTIKWRHNFFSCLSYPNHKI